MNHNTISQRRSWKHRRHARRRGAVLVLVAFLLPVFIILAGFAINSAMLELRKTELFIAADAAARAGGRELTVAQSQSVAQTRAIEYAAKNTVAGTSFTLDPNDIVFGKSTRTGLGRYTFTPNSANANALQITARRDSNSADGPIQLPFPMPGTSQYLDMSQVSTSTQVQVDIALVIDRSGSMAYASNEPAVYPPAPSNAPPGWNFCDPAPPKSRWLDVVAAVQVFNQELQSSPSDELAALVTYADSAKIDKQLTTNYAAINSGMSVYTNSLCSGSTNIGGGINAGVNALATSPQRRNGAVKVLVVLTDGIHNTGTDPVKAAKAAGAQGVMIFTVTFSDEADQARMIQVAKAGQDKHWHATNGSQLSSVFAEIAQRLPTLITE